MENGKDRNYQLIKNFLSSRYTACSSTGFPTPWPIYTHFSILAKVLFKEEVSLTCLEILEMRKMLQGLLGNLTVMDLRLPERFKAQKEPFLMVHVI